MTGRWSRGPPALSAKDEAFGVPLIFAKIGDIQEDRQ